MTEDLPGRLRRRAETILNDGLFEGAEPTATTLREVVHELYVHQAELEIQNEELRTAQQALEASRIQYLQLFQSIPVACLTVTAAGIVGEANAAAERQFGLPMRRLTGRPLTLLVDPADHGRLFTALTRLRETGKWVRQEYAYLGGQGAMIDGLTDARPVALEDGEKGDVLLTITDLTERNIWLREIQHTRDEAERARAAYHHILQAVADGIFGLDPQGRIRFANAAALAITGFHEADLVGRTLEELLPADGPDGVRSALAALAGEDGRQRTIAAARLYRRDGTLFTAEMKLSPIREQGRIEGAIEGAVVAFRDVTAQRAAEEALSLSERRHRVLVQSLHEGLAMLSADGTVQVANAMAERLLQGPAAILLDPKAQELGGPRRPGDHRASTAGRRIVDADGVRLTGLPPAARAARSGKPVVEQILGIAEGDGAAAPVRWLRVSSHPVCGPDGAVQAVVSSVTDITAMKALERELNVALDAKERFMASASHDLRQPVQALMLLSGLLLREPLPDTARTLADQLRVSVGSLGSLLDCMLDISKLEAGLVSPDVAPVDLGELFGRLDREFQPVAASQGIRLRSVVPRLTVHTDGALMERVLRNLLANAIRYTQRGRVLVGVRRRRDRLRLEVWDTGIGIAENQLDRIFQDFYQVGNAARDRREGLGMGLSIAKRLVAMLGGTIEVTSQLGRGSCFCVCLPLPQSGPQAPDGQDGTLGAAAGDGTDGAADGGDALVLLVEDDAVIRMALSLMLEGWGYQVVDAGTVGEAYGHLDEGLSPDLILADYRLPDGATGLMVMDTVRRRLGRDIPGVLLTGDTSSDRLREATGAQCALLHKPIQPHALHSTVRTALGQQ
ncbi:hybrid sensor histidine kinase/response regulator [Azospirillum thermophilum]|uniref:histidine kinase n=1 Tax=Azospirillum thermophilum TaxID=2202148 RepID=A0A2S2CME7_9PROT|nr:PAS domain S-box protein [Azospirillum thermophilum]AWK85642.1 hybrid sensor histidine kinase/response regulator [Azospirillum thermophilum]